MGGTHCESALYGYFQNNKRHVPFSQLVTTLRLTLKDNYKNVSN